MITTISTKDMTRDEWLQERRKSIGGSDAAGIIGMNKYSSPYTVWADKTGRLPPKEETEAIRLGNDLEEYVSRRWAEETGKRIKRYPYIIHNVLYPFAHANIDRAVIGEKAGLECKTTSTLDVRQFNGVEFPEKYYAQCVHYLAVTGWDRWYLAVLVFGRGFYTYVLERDQAEIDALMTAEGLFWLTVQEDDPPAPDGAEATSDTLTTIWAESNGGGIELFDRGEMLDEYMMLRRQKKSIDERISEIENAIKGDMEDAERAVCGAYTVSWKTQQRSNFQAKEFAKTYPQIDLTPFYKQTSSRPFKITMKEQEDA